MTWVCLVDNLLDCGGELTDGFMDKLTVSLGGSSVESLICYFLDSVPNCIV